MDVVDKLSEMGLTLDQFICDTFQSSIALITPHRQIAHLPDDVDAIHDFRVGLRRLRSLLRSFRPLLDEKWAGESRVKLAWLDSFIMPVRDGDVLKLRLLASAERLKGDLDPDVIDSLVGLLELHSRKDRARLKIAMESQKCTDLLNEISGWNMHTIKVLNQESSPVELLKELNKVTWKAIKKEGDEIRQDSSDHKLHELRIKIKRARYLAEACAPVVGKKLKERAKQYEEMQNILGDHQDSFVISQWLAIREQPTREYQTTVTTLLEEEIDQRFVLRHKWHLLWHEVTEGKKLESPKLK